MCAEGTEPDTFISHVIIRKSLIYHDICALLHMNEVWMDYPEMKRQTPLLYSIIMALWLDDYDRLTTQCGTNKMEFNQQSTNSSCQLRVHKASHLPQFGGQLHSKQFYFSKDFRHQASSSTNPLPNYNTFPSYQRTLANSPHMGLYNPTLQNLSAD